MYFDKEGIREKLSQLRAGEVDALKVAPEPWDDLQQEYRLRVAEHLAEHATSGSGDTWVLDPSAVADALAHGKGSTDFHVRKESLVEYVIEGSEGELALVAEIPNKYLHPVVTQFNLQTTPHNRLRLRARHVVRGILMKPQFRQIIAAQRASLDTAPFDHVVAGATRVRYLPMPRFSPTVYLWKVKNDGEDVYVPVAYAIYRS